MKNLACTISDASDRCSIQPSRRVVNIPASYSGGPEFKLGPDTGMLTEVSVVFPQFLQASLGITTS
jgi:hypothetical protein